MMQVSRRFVVAFWLVGCSLSVAFPQNSIHGDLIGKLSGNPVLVTVAESTATARYGELKLGDKVIEAQYILNSDGKPIESVTYEDGKPILYSQLAYDGSKRQSKIVVKTVSDEITYSYSYGASKDTWEVKARSRDGAIVFREEYYASKVGALSVLWTYDYNTKIEPQSAIAYSAEKSHPFRK